MRSNQSKALIITYSIHHQNTEKIAAAMAEPLDAEVKQLKDVAPDEIQNYGLVGFGAGIDGGKHYQPLLAFAESLAQVNKKPAFIFSTSAVKNPDGHKVLRDILNSKGFTIVGEYDCRGYTSRSIFALIGGKNKGRPNAMDIKDAEDFAHKLHQSLATNTAAANM